MCPKCRKKRASQYKLCPKCGRKRCQRTSKSCIRCHNADLVVQARQRPTYGRTRHRKGYVYFKNEGRYVFEHVLAMERHLGRRLLEGENVHHINGVRDDNRIVNLELWTRPQPTGIRARDALVWARETLRRYEAIEAKLSNSLPVKETVSD